MEKKTDGRSLRTDFYRKFEGYEPTWEFKESFLKRCKIELNPYRYATMRNLMYKVGRWERRYHKDVYDFTLDQLKGMLKEFNSTSEMSLMSQKSNLEYYLWYAKKIQNQGDSNVALTVNLSMDEVREFVNFIGSEERFITRDELYNLVEDNLVNKIDQAMILLIFEGILGRENKDLVSLEWRNIDFGSGIIRSGNKSIEISSELVNILEEANNEEIYLLANGNTEKVKNDKHSKNIKRDRREILDKYDSPYFLRPFKNKNKCEQQMTGKAIQRRVLNNCKDYLGRQYLNLKSIYISGLIDRGIMYSRKNFGDAMRNTHWQKFLKDTGENVNIQDTYKLFREFWERAQKRLENECSS